jgi:hypothetical protein
LDRQTTHDSFRDWVQPETLADDDFYENEMALRANRAASGSSVGRRASAKDCSWQVLS